MTIGFDYAFGWEVVSGFQRTFEEAGGKVIQKLWAPVGTLDYGPYIGQINKDADAVFGLFFGSGAPASAIGSNWVCRVGGEDAKHICSRRPHPSSLTVAPLSAKLP